MASTVKSIILDKVLRQMTKGSTLGGFMDLDFKEKQFTKSRCPFSLSRTLNANSLCLSISTQGFISSILGRGTIQNEGQTNITRNIMTTLNKFIMYKLPVFKFHPCNCSCNTTQYFTMSINEFQLGFIAFSLLVQTFLCVLVFNLNLFFTKHCH